MAYTRRRKKKEPREASSSQETQQPAELSEEEVERSQHFMLVLSIIFGLIVLFLVLLSQGRC